MLTTICLVLIVVPGMPDSDRINRHGWPLEYVQTPFADDAAVNLFDAYPIHWSSTSAWNWSRKIGQFNVPNFFVDVGLAALIVTAAVAACEVWRHRRGSYRFALLDFLVAAAVVACIFGWWKYHVRINAVEDELVSSMNLPRPFNSWFVAGDSRLRLARDYRGPEWLSRLMGNPALLPSFEHFSHLQIDSRKLTPDETQQLSNFRFLTTVKLEGQLTSELADALATLPNLRTLDGENIALGGMGGMFGAGIDVPSTLLDSTNVSFATRLVGVKHLKLGNSRLSPADVEQLARMPRLQSIQLRDHNLLIEDLEPLAASATLRSINAEITATQEEWHRFEAAHPQLSFEWPENSLQTFVWSSHPAVSEEWQVMSRLLERWHSEDGAKPSSWNDPDQIDISSVQLTAARVARVPRNSLSQVLCLSLGHVDSVERALDFIRHCAPLKGFDARHIPMTKADLDNIQFESGCELYLQQGPNSLQDFCDLVATLRPNCLTIFASTFSETEADRIGEISSDTILEVYSGLEDDPEESIYPNYDAESESPFH